jgi:hypothetical protein
MQPKISKYILAKSLFLKRIKKKKFSTYRRTFVIYSFLIYYDNEQLDMISLLVSAGELLNQTGSFETR